VEKRTPHFITADIGTSSLKAAIIDTEGNLQSFVRVRYSAGKVSAAVWRQAFVDALCQLRTSSTQISAIAISANGPTFVPVDKNGGVLFPLHWYDRNQGTGDRGQGSVNPPSGNRQPATGNRQPTSVIRHPTSLFLPYVERFIAERPSDFEKTKKLFSAQEWLSRELGAEDVTVLPNERYIPYYWDEAQCAQIGLDRGLFPPFTQLGTIIGKTNSAAEIDFGLSKNIPIVAGGPDFIMALIGTGTLFKGLVLDRAGTSEGINVCTDSLIVNSLGLRSLPHLAPGLFNVSALIPKSGILFDDFRRETKSDNRDYTEHLDALLHKTVTDDYSAEEIVGRKILTEMALAVKEKVALLNEAGFCFSEMRVSGGQAKNALWNKLKAQTLGITLAVPEIPDGELVGDACLCAAALGETKDLFEAAKKMVRIKDYFRP
jgi:sugar (pentulose or hexulose) kinase